MRLTWRDAAATAATAALTTLYVAQAVDASWAPITSVRWLAVAVIGLGLYACITGASDIAASDDMRGPGMVLGPVAGFALIAALITGYSPLVGVAVVASILLWVSGTIRHFRTPPVAPPPRVEQGYRELVRR